VKFFDLLNRGDPAQKAELENRHTLFTGSGWRYQTTTKSMQRRNSIG
jgi:hypothetical protein